MATSLRHALQGAPLPEDAFLSGAEKNQWAAERRRFYITGLAIDDEGRYGARWIVSVLTDDDDEKRRIALGRNGRRDGLLFHMLPQLKDGHIGPCVLATEVTTDGKSPWVFKDAPADDDPVDAAIDPDDIPF